MKKIFLAGSVIVVFLLYSLHQKNEADQVHVILPPSNNQISTTQQSTAAPTTSSSGNSTGKTTPTPVPTGTQYKDGTYTGSAADAFYGNIQVQAVISHGRITDVVFLQYPNDRDTSIQINTQAMPLLKQEAIVAQNANVDTVSGATDSSGAFRQSLQDALSQAKI